MSRHPRTPLLSPEVDAALRHGEPVVALESTLIAQGLPRPRNLEVARQLEATVREESACPATVAVLDGVAHVGLNADQVARLAEDASLRKLGRRDLPVALALGASGATTVSATAWLASRAGVRVFATGGIGGIHRGFSQSFDESADLGVLAATRITVVSAGVKSILDIAATLERLESFSVTTVGFATSTFPGFYLRTSGHRLDWTVESAADVASIMHFQDELGIGSALLVANPVAEGDQLDPALHDRALEDALAKAERNGIRGQQITPFLLAELVNASGGASLEANIAAVKGTARLGAQIAVAFCSVTATSA